MIAALIILAALVAVGGTLWLLDRRHNAAQTDAPATPVEAEPAPEAEQCCGMHITCERDSLLTAIDEPVVYFDDEELDEYAGRTDAEYSEAEIEQFRDILLTLLPADIAPWARSLQRRGIELPEAVRQELLMIVAEARAGKAS